MDRMADSIHAALSDKDRGGKFTGVLRVSVVPEPDPEAEAAEAALEEKVDSVKDDLSKINRMLWSDKAGSNSARLSKARDELRKALAEVEAALGEAPADEGGER